MLVEKEKICGEKFCKVASDKAEKYMKWMDRVEMECELRDEYNCFGFCAVLSGVLNLLFLFPRFKSH